MADIPIMKEERKREDGYYWIKIHDKWVVAEYCLWVVGHWQSGSWCGWEENVDEIDERRIIRLTE